MLLVVTLNGLGHFRQLFCAPLIFSQSALAIAGLLAGLLIAPPLCAQLAPAVPQAPEVGQFLPEFDRWPEARSDSGGELQMQPLSQGLEDGNGARIPVKGFRVEGMGAHHEHGVDADTVQAVASAAFVKVLQSSMADPVTARFSSELYSYFASAAWTTPIPDLPQSLADLVAEHPPMEPGRSPRTNGFSIEQLAALDEVLLRAYRDPARAASVTVAQTIALLRELPRGLSIGQMNAVADAVTAFYRQQGLMLAQAYIPEQTLGDDAIVRIAVIEGRLGRVMVENNDYYPAKIIYRKVDAVWGSVISVKKVESSLLRINDLPGLSVFGSFRPGERTGEADLVLQVVEERPVDIELAADNYGSDLTGEYRARFRGHWNSPLGRGDRLQLDLVESASPSNNSYSALTYQLPLGNTDFSLGVSGSLSDFTVTEGEFSQFPLDGETINLSLSLAWQWQRSRRFNSHVWFNTGRTDSELSFNNQSLGDINDDEVTLYSLGWGMDRRDDDGAGVNVVTSSVTSGNRDFIDSGTGFKDSADFALVDFSVVRHQSLWPGQALLMRLQGQYSPDSLSSVTQFSLAGPGAVRAYPVSEVLSDRGLFASLEYQMAGPDIAGPWGRSWRDLVNLSVFADYAYGQDEDEAAAGSATEVLSGLGVGVRFGLPGRFSTLLELSGPLSSLKASDEASSNNPRGEEASFSDLRVYAKLVVPF